MNTNTIDAYLKDASIKWKVEDLVNAKIVDKKVLDEIKMVDLAETIYEEEDLISAWYFLNDVCEDDFDFCYVQNELDEKKVYTVQELANRYGNVQAYILKSIK